MRTITHNIMNQVCQKNSIKCQIQFEITNIYILGTKQLYCRSLFVPLSSLCWQLCCLFFFDLRILITSLVSLNSFYLI